MPRSISTSPAVYTSSRTCRPVLFYVQRQDFRSPHTQGEGRTESFTEHLRLRGRVPERNIAFYLKWVHLYREFRLRRVSFEAGNEETEAFLAGLEGRLTE